DDVPSGPSSNSGSAASAPAQPSSTDSKDTTGGQATGDAAPGDKAAAPEKNDEAAWKLKFHDERSKLADAERELDLLQREAQKAQVQYYSDPQKAMSEQYNRKEVNDKDTKIAAKKQEIAQIKQ